MLFIKNEIVAGDGLLKTEIVENEEVVLSQNFSSSCSTTEATKPVLDMQAFESCRRRVHNMVNRWQSRGISSGPRRFSRPFNPIF